MDLYLVQLELPKALCHSFQPWLIEHAEQMVQLPCFTSYELLQRVEPSSSEVTLEVRYRWASNSGYQDYIDHFAAEMRGQMPEAFRGKIKIKRSLGSWQILP